MRRVLTSIRCPSCHGSLEPVRLACEGCGIAIDGRFVTNEFSSMSAEDLHLLRIFVRTEGSIRDMEAALGVSYPTVKSRLAELRQRLGLGEIDPKAPVTPREENVAPPPPGPDRMAGVMSVLDELQQGGVTPEQAAQRLRKAKQRGGR